MSDKLDKEEKDILNSFEKSEWHQIPNMKKEISRHIQIAQATHRKDKRINIRISERDLGMLKIEAIKEGIPYQTLISSLIHKYINGQFIDKKILGIYHPEDTHQHKLSESRT